MNELLISVIVPVYNVGEYLVPCLDSILGQTYQTFELLLVDDGSTDGSGAVCDQYAARDPRVRVFHQENQGVSAARNLALEQTAGEFLCFVDADDYVTPDYLENLLGCLREHHADMVCCNAAKVSTANRVLVPNIFSLNEGQLLRDSDALIREIATRGVIWALLCRKTLVDTLRFKSLRYGEDSLFLFDLLRKKPVVFQDCHVGYYYVQREESAMSKGSHLRMAGDHLIVCAYRYWNLPEVLPETRQTFLENYANKILSLAHWLAVSENTAAQQQWRDLLSKHLRLILPLRSHLPTRLRRRLQLLARFPQLYNLLICLNKRCKNRS